MKVIINLALVLAVIVSSGIGCLIIFEVLTFDQGLDYILKTLAAIILLGASSAAINYVNTKNKSDE